MATLVTAAGGQRITAAWINANLIPGFMTACIDLSNGWVNHGGSTPPLSVRAVDAVQAAIVGQLNPGVMAANTQIANLPSTDFYPASTQVVNLYVIAGTGSGAVYPCYVNPTGIVSVGPSPIGAGATGIFIAGTYQRDI
jgi:hypothetical protein